MATRVQIAFDLTATTPVNFFVLDDSVRGVLDNTQYMLGGDTLVDVTTDVRSIQIRRGRSRQLERFTSGNANLVLDNRTRKYDPLNASSPYYGSIVPRKQITIDIDGTPLYTGSVEDWNFGYTLEGDSTAEPSCTDALSIVAQRTLAGGTAIAQKTGARVSALLDEIGWPSSTRTISTGEATLDANIIEPGANALQVMSQVADVSEPGALFIGKAGDFVFKSRADLQAFTSGATFGTGGIPFTGMEVVYGAEELFNSVAVTYTAGSVVAGTATSENIESQTAYGVFDKVYDTYLGSSADAQALADWQATSYSQPRYRVDALTVSVTSLSSTQRATLLALDLGSVVLVKWTPNDTGTEISQYVLIDGIEHTLNPAYHEVTFTLGETTASFILDDLTFGVLDSNILGF